MGQADSRSDQQLVAAANSGEEAAFEALYWRHRDWVVRLAWRFTGEQADALDVLQETFAYLLRKLPHLRLSANMTTFLYPVVRNLSLAVRRKRRAGGDAALDQLPARPEPATEQRGELAAALASLPEAQREVLLLRFVDGMSLEEIAQAMAVPLGTIKSRLHTALATLRADPRTREYFG